MNTAFWYQYRDGSNYKQAKIAVFAGVPDDLDAANLLMKEAADAGEYFIAHQVGLEDLRERWDSHYEDDHYWHEIDHEGSPLEVTLDAPTDERDAQEFVLEFIAAGESWDEAGAQARLDQWLASTREGR